MADLPDHDAFARHLGETFVLQPEGEAPIEVELIEAKAFAKRGADAPAGIREVPFSLLFRAQGGCELPQRIYRVEHDALGPLELFLVPVGSDDVGMRFEAVFN